MSENGKNKQSDDLIKQDIVMVTGQRISELVDRGKLHLPGDYSAENALMAAWLKIQETVDKNGKPALAVCTKESIANALLDMIVQGLTPAKKQVAFVVYGDKMVCQREYFGDMALLKRAYPGYEVYAEPIYKGDKVVCEVIRGKRFIRSHEQNFSDIGSLEKIVGAYATIYDENDEQKHCEIMTIAQIKNAWAQGPNYPPRQGKKCSHELFPEEFTKKTVIARACKRMINSSNDAYLVRAVERQAHLVAETEVQERVKEEANQDVIDLPPPEEPHEDEEVSPQEPEGQEDERESPTSSTARFSDLIDEHELNATEARRLVAKLRAVKDVRHLGNADYEVILGDTAEFLSQYNKQYRPNGAQPTLGGPGF